MKRIDPIVVAFFVSIGVGVCLYYSCFPVIYALGSRTVEFTVIVIDGETKTPIRGATITFYDDPVRPQERKPIAELITDEWGNAKYVRENTSVEDVLNIPAGRKLEGVTRHPRGIGTFVERSWCTLDIAAKGYEPVHYGGFWEYDYEDKGYVREGEYHQFEFTILLRRRPAQ